MRTNDAYMTLHEHAPNVTAAAKLAEIKKMQGSKHYMLSNTYDGRLQLFAKVTKEPGQIGGWFLVGIWRTWCEAQDFIKAHALTSIEDKSDEHANREGLRALAARHRFIRDALSQNSKKQEQTTQQKRGAPKQELLAQPRAKKKDESGSGLASHNGAHNGGTARHCCASEAEALAKNLDEVCLDLTDQSIHLKMSLNGSEFKATALQDVCVKVKDVLQRLQGQLPPT